MIAEQRDRCDQEFCKTFKPYNTTRNVAVD